MVPFLHSVVSKRSTNKAKASTVLLSVREEHFNTRFALLSFELPRAKVGEAGWALKRFLSCPREGGVLRLPSKRDTARKLPVVLKSSWRVEMARQARGRGDVALDGQASSLSLSISRQGWLP